MKNTSNLTDITPNSNEIVILYVEDETTIRELVSKRLQNYFKNILVAENGEEGYELFDKHRPQIVVTDISMPILSGVEMIEKIGKLSRRNTHFIVTTAYNDSDTMLECIELGVENYLVKPININKLVGKISDIVDKVEISKKLHNARQHYEALVEFFIVTKTDKNGVITFANDLFCDISGFKREEIIGQNHNIVRHPDMEKEVFENLWNQISAKKVWKGVVKNRKKDGGFYIVDATIFPVLDTDGEVLEYMSIRQDITELELLKIKTKEEEEKIKAQESEKRLLSEVNKAKDSFLVIFTHELKTPLNAIINFTEYVVNKLKSPKDIDRDRLIELLISVERNGIYMLQMVTNLLEVAKLKAGKIAIKNTQISLNLIVDDVIKSFYSLTRDKKIDTKVLADDEFYVNSDELRIKQIFSNLYSNSIKYCQNRITVKLYRDNDQKVLISFEDDGEGIKNKDKVFGLFEQDGSDIKKDIKGSGVGLYFITLLKDELNLDVTLEDSKELGGAKFIVKFKG